MTVNINLKDKANRDLCVMEIAIEAATLLLAETVTDSVAAGLSYAFADLRDDVEVLIKS